MARALKICQQLDFRYASLADVIARVSSIGFDGIELVEQQYITALRSSKVEGHGLEVISICGMHPGPEPEI